VQKGSRFFRGRRGANGFSPWEGFPSRLEWEKRFRFRAIQKREFLQILLDGVRGQEEITKDDFAYASD